MPSLYERLAKVAFGWLAESTVANFDPLKPYLKGARIKILIKAWVSVIYLSSFLAFFSSLAAVLILGMVYDIFYLIYWSPWLRHNLPRVALPIVFVAHLDLLH